VKALLVIFTFYVGESVHTLAVPYPTMLGCQAAARQLTIDHRLGGMAIKQTTAYCAEYR
jgi:hypothetical protein